VLRALHAAGFDIALVVTRADARRGRGTTLTPSPVKAAALELGLTVSHRVADALDVGADLGVVVAFGRIIKPDVLAALPMVNLHFSLLPRWRGAAPVERAILAGDTRTGVCLMDVEEGLDTGGIRATTEVDIGPDESADELRGRLAEAGTELLLHGLRAGLYPAVDQLGETVYAEKIEPDELHLDWTRPAIELHRLVRVGGAYTSWRGRRLKVWRSHVVDRIDPDGADAHLDAVPVGPGGLVGLRVQTGHGFLELVEVQPEGKGRMDGGAWRRGLHPAPGPDEGLGP
jgi:methionyl-tRNA formyltransferase